MAAEQAGRERERERGINMCGWLFCAGVGCERGRPRGRPEWALSYGCWRYKTRTGGGAGKAPKLSATAAALRQGGIAVSLGLFFLHSSSWSLPPLSPLLLPPPRLRLVPASYRRNHPRSTKVALVRAQYPRPSLPSTLRTLPPSGNSRSLQLGPSPLHRARTTEQ